MRAKGNNTKFKLVLASHEPDQAASLLSRLKGLGHQVLALAQDGAQACRMSRKLKPDLALVVHCPPGLDGWQVARYLQQDQPVPVVLMSASWPRRLPPQGLGGVFGLAGAKAPAKVLGPVLDLAWRNYHRQLTAQGRVDELSLALEQRKAVERAKGLLMDALGLNQEQARLLLERLSRRRGEQPHQVAQQLLGPKA